MKKIMSITLAAALLIGATATTGSAAELKTSGTYLIEALGGVNVFAKDKANTINVLQRARLQFDFIANENLKGVFQAEIGTNNWGNGDKFGTSGSGLEYGNRQAVNARLLYVDFTIPTTPVNFRIGQQMYALPQAYQGCSSIDNVSATALMSIPFTENVGVTVAWTRLDSNVNKNNKIGDNYVSAADAAFSDMYSLTIPVDFAGINVTPYVAYAAGNGDNNYATSGNFLDSTFTAIWTGAAITIPLSPVSIKADFAYSNITANKTANTAIIADENVKSSGIWFDIAVAYTELAIMTPEVFFIYTSGASTEGTGANQTYNAGYQTIGNDFDGPSSFFGGSAFGLEDMPLDGVRGYMSVGLNLKDITPFTPKLTHDFIFTWATSTVKEETGYAAGTLAPGSLAPGDTVIAIDLNSKFQVFEQLAVILELGYANYADNKGVSTAKDEDMSMHSFRTALGLNYSF